MSSPLNGFLRTLVIGFAAIAVVILSAGATLLLSGKSSGAISRDKLLEFALSPEEKAHLAKMHEPVKTMPSLAIPALKTDELLAQLAEMTASQRANDLVTDLRRRTEALETREKELSRREAEQHVARADLNRLHRQLQEQEAAVQETLRQLAQEKSTWASQQVEQVKKVNTINAIEKARYQEQAKLFEQMKDNAWQSLRRFPPREISRYLAFMEQKKAARMMVLAQQDESGPALATAIHRELLTMDPSGQSGSQAERLAALYLLMPAVQVLPFLKDSPDEEVADIFVAMAQGGNVKQRAALMEALRQADGPRQLSIQRHVERRTPVK